MAKAWEKKLRYTLNIMYCQYCEEWHDKNRFTSKDCYTTDDCDYIEVNGEYYSTGYNQYTVWTHDDCSEPAANVDETPRYKKTDVSYVCGECGAEFYELQEARECCIS